MEAFDADWDDLDSKYNQDIHKKLINYVTKEEMENQTCSVLEAIQKIDDKLETHFVESIEAERDRLASEILNYHQDLSNGLFKSQMSYEHIHKCYRRYKNLKGNSFVDETFTEIIKMMRDQNEVN